MFHRAPNQYVKQGESITIDDTSYSYDLISQLSSDAKQELGIEEVFTVGERKDDRYFYVSEELSGNIRTIVNTPKSDEQIDQMLRSRINAESLQYLKDTDWYVIRRMENRKEIPKDILALRERARLNIVKD